MEEPGDARPHIATQSTSANGDSRFRGNDPAVGERWGYAFARGRRSCRMVATSTPAETKPIMMVAIALTSGATPSLIFEKITIGSVDEPGPDTKLAITRSSSESVKASSRPRSAPVL